MIRIAILDDTPLFLELIAARFGAENGFQVVGTAGDSDAGHELIVKLQPDVVLMEVGLPGRGSFELASEIQRMRSGLRTIFLTTCLSDVFIDTALRL